MEILEATEETGLVLEKLFSLSSEGGNSTSTTLEPLVDGGISVNLTLNVILCLILCLSFSIHRRRKIIQNRRLSSATPLLIFSQPKYTDSSNLLDIESSYFSWITQPFRLTEDEIFDRTGRDGVLYLSFLKLLIMLCGLYMIGSLGLVLPFNLSGYNLKDSFGATTIYNLEKDSPKLWLHVGLGMKGIVGLYSILGFVLAFKLREIDSQLSGKYVAEKNKVLAVCIENFPKTELDEKLLKTNLEKIFPGQILEVRIAQDIRQGMTWFNSLYQSYNNWRNAYAVTTKNDKRKKIFRNCDCVDAIDYHSNQVGYFRAKLRAWKNQPRLGTGYVFVTFPSQEYVLACISRHRLNGFPEIDPNLRASEWDVSLAWSPHEVVWEYLGISKAEKFLRVVLVNVPLFLFFFILVSGITIFYMTSNLIFMEDFDGVVKYLHMEVFQITENSWNITLTSFVFCFIPSILMTLLALSLPHIFTASSYYEGHCFSVIQELVLMRKTFIGLTFFLIIQPAIFLVLLSGYMENSYLHTSLGPTLKKIFFPTFGTFFVNFLISMTFFGNALHLFRISGIMKKKWATLRIPSEKHAATTGNRVSVFNYGLHYAHSLCVLAITLVFSCSVPLIVPIAVFYFSFKYWMDKYHLNFNFPRPTYNKYLLGSIHTFILIILIIFQVGMASFFLLRSLYPQAAVILLVMLLSIFFYWFMAHRRSKFRQHQFQSIDQAFTNQQSLKVRKAEASEVLNLWQDAYVPPIFKNGQLDRFFTDSEIVDDSRGDTVYPERLPMDNISEEQNPKEEDKFE